MIAKYLIIFFLYVHVGNALNLQKQGQYDFIIRWNRIQKTIYNGNSIRELLQMCPNGCGSAPGYCKEFPKTGPKTTTLEPCNDHDIVVLRKAQEIARGWKEIMSSTSTMLIVHSAMMAIVVCLILILVIRGHYRFRDLWFLPSHRQWELERDPTWGLPGKVWGLLESRVVRKKGADVIDRKYKSYTANPTTLGDSFWYYKQALRDMYKPHHYYKRNRFFHKLGWQFTKLRKLIPETLRRHKNSRRRAGELEELRSHSSSAEGEIQENLPWEIDLADEINLETLRKAKVRLQEQVDKETKEGHFVNGRYQIQHHHHHHHHPHQPDLPLTKDEIENTARQMEVDPNADFVNVDGVMRRNPAAQTKNEKTHRHHHHHHKKMKS